jgi:pimeloyl-ACP methyl ester carboxylesterase
VTSLAGAGGADALDPLAPAAVDAFAPLEGASLLQPDRTTAARVSMAIRFSMGMSSLDWRWMSVRAEQCCRSAEQYRLHRQRPTLSVRAPFDSLSPKSSGRRAQESLVGACEFDTRRAPRR